MSINGLQSPIEFETIDQVKAYLSGVPMYATHGPIAANFTLDPIRAFLAHAGQPQHAYPTIHVAGTNGKGTTCHMLASSLQEAGLRTGLFTSPHLIRFNERVQVDAQEIPDEALLAFFREHWHWIRRHRLSFFELSTAIAFWYFRERKVDVAVIETGLGGRLDATNTMSPLLTIITTVGLDHTDVLGPTITDIAREKAGIARPGTPMILGEMPEQARTQIHRTAGEVGALLHSAPESRVCLKSVEGERVFQLDWKGQALSISARNRPSIDVRNLSIVATALEYLNTFKPEWTITASHLRDGVERMTERFRIHGHFQKLHLVRPDLPAQWYFDGAHNPQALQILRAQLQDIAPLEEWTLICSLMRDKMTDDTLGLLSGFRRHLFYPNHSSRSATWEELAVKTDRFEKLVSMQEAQNRFASELVIFTGSFYFYDVIMSRGHSIPPPT